VTCPDRMPSSSEDRVPWGVALKALAFGSSLWGWVDWGAEVLVLMGGAFGFEDQNAGMTDVECYGCEC